MKISPPFAILALVGVAVVALSYQRQMAEQEQMQVRRTQCDVALTFLQNLETFPSQPWLLLEVPEKSPTMEQIELALAQNPNLKNDPDLEIEIKKAKSAELGPIKLCKSIKKWAVENRVRVERGEPISRGSTTPDWLVTDKNDKYGWHIVQISMPVISEDGKSAYFNVSEYFGPLAGGGDALEYKKLSDGRWKFHSRVGRYIS